MILLQLAIGCNLCGMFIPGLCAATCPMAGLFCGGSGYLCAIASGENPTTVAPRVEDLEFMEEAKAPRAFVMKDDEMSEVEDEDAEGRSINPKMAMLKEKRDVEEDGPEARGSGEEHDDDDGHQH